jgi:FKBP-type peptidyl-prolyl cis-trans isomerase
MQRFLGVSAAIILAMTWTAGCNSKKGAVTHPSQFSGVLKEDIKVGTGPKADDEDLILVQYVGTLATNGKEFDTNDPKKSEKNKNPLAFKLVKVPGVILGMAEGVKGMQPGGVRKVSVPWYKAYGAVGSEPLIPAYADLIFEIKALAVVKKDELDTVEVEDLTPGTGAEVKVGDRVTVTYVGSFVNGREFDNVPTPDHKLSFLVGREEVISGFDKGMLGMKVGGKRRITIPPNAGFGAYGRGVIGGNQVLIYDVTLLDVKSGGA